MSSTPYIVPGHEHVVIQDPNNITPEECHALALCGAEAWNKWREKFPIWLDRTNTPRNIAQFKGDCYVEDFSDFDFGDGALINVKLFRSPNFKNCSFGNGAKFKGVNFNCDTSFKNSDFGSFTIFYKCRFLKNATHGSNGVNFDGIKFGYMGFKKNIFWKGSFCGASGHELNFEQVKFKERVKFLIVNEDAEIKFDLCRFYSWISLDKCEFSSLRLNRVVIEKNLSIADAKLRDLFIESSGIKSFVKLSGTKISGFFNLEEVCVEGDFLSREAFFEAVHIINTELQKSSVLDASIIKSKLLIECCKFLSELSFVDVEFGSSIDISCCEFQGVDLSVSRNTDKNQLHGLYVGDCIFLGCLNLSGRDFTSKASFGVCQKELRHASFLSEYGFRPKLDLLKANGSGVLFAVPPKFYKSKLFADTDFENVRFPKESGNVDCIRAYCALKKAFVDIHDFTGANRFVAYEFAEEQEFYRKNNKLVWGLYYLYRIFSGYGFSIKYPLLWLLGFFLLTMAVYSRLLGYCLCILPGKVCDWQATLEIVKYTFQAVPFMGGFEISEGSKLEDLDSSYIALATMFFHKLSTIVLIFLTGLALRNMFRMK